MRKKTVRLALLTAMALILSWLEGLLLPSLAIPGVKLGLANVATLLSLYLYSWREAALVSVARVLLSGLLFGGLFTMLYALAGALVALAAMAPLRRTGLFSVFGVSVAGGFFHNAGQLLVAVAAARTPGLASYLPVLALAGVLTGLVNALLARIVLTRVRPV